MKNKLQALIVIPFLTLLISFSASAQLDSVNVTASYSDTTILIDDQPIYIKTITSQIWVNDFDFFGNIIVTIYDLDADYPVDKQKYSKQELIDAGKILNNVITVSSDIYEADRSYIIEVIVSNFQGLYLPFTEITLAN